MTFQDLKVGQIVKRTLADNKVVLCFIKKIDQSGQVWGYHMLVDSEGIVIDSRGGKVVSSNLQWLSEPASGNLRDKYVKAPRHEWDFWMSQTKFTYEA